MDNQILLLSAPQIAQKLMRMAYEIYEQDSNEKELYLIGIEAGGLIVAKNLKRIIEQISPLKTHILPLSINKETPLKDNLHIETNLTGKSVILIDDVANSGKTLAFALKPILAYQPSKIKVVVLVDRKHKNYPIKPNIIGHSLSTTLQDRIIVKYDGEKISGVFLE